MSEPVRLSKRLVEQLGCSRREAELYIEGGWVTVDGVVVEQPQFKVEQQHVELLPGARAESLEPVTLLLHQAAGMDTETARLGMSMTSLSEAHREGVRPLHGHFTRQACIAPLEPGASGLQVFTQDWRVTRKINADLRKLEQEFVVQVRGEASAQMLERLARGVTRNDRELPKAKASWQNETHLRLVLKNPQPGQISELCAYLRLELLGMRRIRLGGVSMGKLALGQWRYLMGTERF
ncbi:rRNA pseudouridine synthase [Pseudomonas putida]|uniref:Dual-specificity RNA pseudouridine synthase RluF n=1 Tax=Pseudomonas parafulva TaxID=157782 RepID=A0AAJ0PFE0_9PSED|nr:MULTISPECIES: rRNA pseudouridine synthase [Pseudomonas]KTT17925.1 RNA-binding protein S4 [Pseudomonas parafulva]MBF8651378.1 rRNA pseudouridine synthase [Pseudomonas putida]MBF8655074.1 rRNA pseudouridine synthase [Pseudomonas putida]MBF8680199.1 rRNA pseudouridine synthase [Pseudomonas fulva]MBF8718633.1 rRNA pseudouridine synthase [Pseudomonas fulva]